VQLQQRFPAVSLAEVVARRFVVWKVSPPVARVVAERHQWCIRMRVLARMLVFLTLLSAMTGLVQTSGFQSGREYQFGGARRTRGLKCHGIRERLGSITPPLPDGSLVGLPLPTNVLPVAVGNFCCGWGPTNFDPLSVSYGGPVQDWPAGVSEVTFQTDGAGSYAMCVPLEVCTRFQIHESANEASSGVPAARPDSSARPGDSPRVMPPALPGYMPR